MSETLVLEGLTKHYSVARPALDHVNLRLESGRVVGLLGPNGSGKTTLMKLVAGLLTPTEGSIQICGLPVGPQSKALVSYLPDRTYLREGRKVSQQLDLFQDFYGDFDRQRAERMLQVLNVPLDAKFRTLSKGNREKVQLVLVMSRRARLYLLDEPIGGVDPATRDYILDTIIRNYDPEAVVLISTHLISDVEKVLDEVLFIKQGKVTLQASVDDIRQQYGMSVDEYFREVFKC